MCPLMNLFVYLQSRLQNRILC